MLFYEPLFLFAFFPTVYLAFLVCRPTWRLGLLLAASIGFYLWSEPLFVPLVLASGALDHFLARRIAVSPAGGRRARWLVGVGVIANLAILFHFKYTAFAVRNLDWLLKDGGLSPWAIPAIALPVGVSFIVFEKITYLVDIARRISVPAPTLASYLTYVFFFPKLLAGPIIKYHDMAPQLASLLRPRLEDISVGFTRFMLGVVKKSLLANTLATGADLVFDAPATQIGFVDAWAGVMLFTFQIYFDFSAYSDMAIGIARMFGFRLRENFNMPYLSCSITEFWRRWHISLSSWIREYLYIPLGGSRVSAPRTLLNLWVCFLASGLWHGAAWTYVVWGAYHGVFLVLDKLFLLRVLKRMPVLAANLLTFGIVVVGWILFRAGTLDQAGRLLSAMAHPSLPGRVPGLYFTPDIQVACLVAGALCTAPRLPGFWALAERAMGAAVPRAALASAIAALFVVSVAFSIAAPFKPFLYFRF